MSINSHQLIWIKIQIENKRFMRIPIPVPLYIVQELLDCFMDLMSIVCCFTPKRLGSDSFHKITPYTTKMLIAMTMKLLDSIGADGTYDLVDVATDKVKVSVQVK